MIRSMTGFGAASAEAGGVSVRVEVRSVNHRHLQAKLRLPPELAQLEPRVDGLVQGLVGRGALTLGVHVTRASGSAEARLDAEVARRYRDEFARLGRELGVERMPTLAELAQLPGVLVGGDDSEVGEAECELVLTVAEQALRELVEMREREGAALLADLQQHAAAIEQLLGTVVELMPGVQARHQAHLRQRVQELVGDSVEVSPADLARELAVLADRLDVSEETARLAAHLGQLRELLAQGGATGRKLDFLAQEFFREANTIGSKCNDAAVAHLVVELKTHIERMREQVQNVE